MPAARLSCGLLKLRRRAADQHVAGIAVIGAGQDLHQRRLAGRIVADQPHDLARIEPQIDVVQGPHGAERLADVAHLDDRRGGVRRSSGMFGLRFGAARSARGGFCRPARMFACRSQMSISTATMRMRPVKTLTQCCGMTKEPPPGRMMLSCSSARMSVMTAAPGQRADHGAVAAEDRPAADDDGGDGVELAELPGGRVEAAEERGVDDAGHGRAQGGEHQRDEAHAPGVDAGIVGGAAVAAGRVDHLPERRVGEDDAGDDRRSRSSTRSGR